ncbi:MAG: multicopper oxidase family protein [Deltaproteobacteria bacterium]|nr:multicopper oxidase family protein [Deltaproteobacteria bacterium]
MRRFLPLLLLPLLTACPSEPTPEAPAGFPTVEGLVPLEDLDPTDGVVEYEMQMEKEDLELLEGQSTRMWTFNKLSPGPLLQANVGDRVKVHVTNQLDEPTTVHWHGLRIAAEMDGVVMGSLVAIQPGETFTYEFTPPEAGTFWYHPHVRSNVQVEAGLYGAFVVHEAPEMRPEVDADRMFVLDDVRLDSDGSIADHATAGMDIMHGRAGNVLLVNGSSDAPRVDMVPGSVERWRLVNTANARTLQLEFRGLEVREIGADAGLWPQAWVRTIDELELPVGARAELEVRLADGETQGEMNFVVLVSDGNGGVTDDAIQGVRVRPPGGELTPIGAAGHTADPTMRVPDRTMDDTVNQVVEFSGYNDNGDIVFTMNGRSWPDYDDWTVDRDEIQVIDITNDLGMEHPFHLHGQWFSVLGIDGDPVEQPGLRDTVLVRGFETVRIAASFENPGDWMVHCHILEHAEAGMMAMVTVRD